MKEAAVGREQPVITHGESAEVAEPREGAFHDPAPTIPTQTAAVLIRRPRMVRAGRNDRLNVPVLEPPPQAVAVISAVGDQPVRIRPRPPSPMGPGDFDRGEGLSEEVRFLDRPGIDLHGIAEGPELPRVGELLAAERPADDLEALGEHLARRLLLEAEPRELGRLVA